MAKPKRGRMHIPRQPNRLSEKYSNPTTTLPANAFLARPPLKIARDFATKELADRASPSEIAWLYEHRVLWLRALHQRRNNLDTAIAQARLSLAALRPALNAQPSAAYLARKRQVDAENRGRLHFINQIKLRMDEVSTLCGVQRVFLNGDMVSTMVRLAQLIEDDDVQAAHDLALFYAEAWQDGIGSEKRR